MNHGIRILLVLAVLSAAGAVLSTASADSATPVEIDDEVRAVIERSYFNGAFNDLDTESMRKGFHPDFAIFAPSGTEISRYPIDAWIESIDKRKADANFERSKTGMDCEIVWLDVTGGCASAKVEISKNGTLVFTDYLSLLEFDDGWKIVAKVYHRHVN